ncbi:MAG: hypothetical protein GY941_03575 [Planctomycetes bacterium]|nr:hypothetical protein [Planctomycetota bacterium]
MMECMRVGCVNVNGMTDACKRREVVECFKSGSLDVLGVGETHMKGKGMFECGSECENMTWEGMKGGVVWTGLDEGYKGRGKEGCALLVSERVWKGMNDYGWMGSRLVWMTGKIGIVKYAWICVYAPVNVKTKKGKGVMKKFWEEVSECIGKFEKGRRVILMGDMNGKVGNKEVGGVVGRWGVEGVNENGEYLVDLCSERGLFLANTFFEHKMIHRFTWKRRDEMSEQMSLIDYIAVDERLRKDVLDAKVVRGMYEGSDHYMVMARMRVRMEWEYGGRSDVMESEKVVASDRLREKGYREEYVRRVSEVLREERLGVGCGSDVNDVFEKFKRLVIGTAVEVVGYRGKRGSKSGNAWWTKGIKDAVEEKRKAYKRMLQRNVPEEVRERRKREYKTCKREVRRLVRESKERVDDEFGRKLSDKFKENKKLFWKEVKKERGEGKTEQVRMKGEDGVSVSGSEAVKGVWKRHFERLMNERSEGQAVVTCWGMGAGRGPWEVQGEIRKDEVKGAIERLKVGKAPGIDGMTAEMLKYGGEEMVEWMLLICGLAWSHGVVPGDWTRAVIVPLYKGKGCRDRCDSYRGISLLSVPGKVYGRVLMNRLREVTECRVSEEQGGFRKGRGCTDQIFAVRMTVEKFLGKGRKLYAAFMDLEKAYDRVDRMALWDVLGMYGVGGCLLEGIKAFYKGASACVRVDGRLSETFDISVGVRQGCVMSPWLFNVYMDGCIREMKARVGDIGVGLQLDGVGWSLVASLFADDTVLMAESERELQRVVKEFDTVCKRRKLRVNVGKSKVMVFERAEGEVIDFATPYRVGVPNESRCEIMLGREMMEEVDEFKYLGTVLCKHGSMEGETRERAVKGRQVIGSLGRIMKGRNVSMEVKRGLRNSIVLPTLTYASETWTWNSAQQSRIGAVEMSYLRGACGLSRWDEVSNESVYERCGMGTRAIGIECGVVEWVKRSTLRWFGHVERMQGEEFTKKVYKSEIEGPGVRGRPPVKWSNRVEEYMNERGVGGRGGLHHGRREYLDRENWRRFCRGHPLRGSSRRERGVRAIDR